MAEQMRVSLKVVAVGLGVTSDELVRLVRDLGVPVEGEAITPEDQSFLLAFQPSDYCTRREVATILGVSEKRVQRLVESDNLPYCFCHNRLRFPREAIKTLAADDHRRQRALVEAPRRKVVVPRMAPVADNTTVAQAMAIEEKPRQTTERYVLWMLVASLALTVGAIIYKSIWGHPPPG